MAKKDAAPVEEEKKKSGKLKWILLLAVLLLVGGGAAAYWFFLGPGSTPRDEAVTQGEAGSPKSPRTEFAPEIVTLEPFIVNLADPLGRRFLRMTLDVEVLNRTAAAEVQRSNSRIRDAVILLLAGKSFADLASMEGKIVLKNEIVERMNQIVGGGQVTNVYFTEFVVQ